MVYYRKYRPQTVSELDLEEVREKITAILEKKEIPHAFLFTGPKGLGKTSAARIIAKAINCEKRFKTEDLRLKGKEKPNQSLKSDSIEPCNKCDACFSITSGSNLDVIEIDAASNRGIDEIRDLREKIKFSPSSLPKKVYIIDEVHMLTQDAFNALLKTLEEPPSHAIFILCTTEEEKIPATISSRTFHVQFEKPKKEEVIRCLERIIAGEKIDIEKEVLDEIYKLSEGSFRDAAKILEELSILSKSKKITNATMDEIYKTASTDVEVKKLMEALSKKDTAQAMTILEHLSQKGADFKVVMERMAELIHGMILIRAGLKVNVFDIENFSAPDLKRLLESLNQNYKDMKFSILPQIPLEIVVVEWCLEEVKSSKLKVQSEEGEVKVESDEKLREDKREVETSQVEPQITKNKEPQTKVNEPTDQRGVLFDKNAVSENFLASLLARVKNDNHSIAGILRGCRLVELGDQMVTFETKFKFHKDKLNEAKTRAILDKRSSELLSRGVRVVVNLVQK